MSELNRTWKELRPQIGAFLNQLDNLAKGMDKKMEIAYRAGAADTWSMAQQILNMDESEAAQTFGNTNKVHNVLHFSADEASKLLYEKAKADYELAKHRQGTYGNMQTLMGVKSDEEKSKDVEEQLRRLNQVFSDLDDILGVGK